MEDWHFREAGMAVYWRMTYGELAYFAEAILRLRFPASSSGNLFSVTSVCMCNSSKLSNGIDIAKPVAYFE